MFDEDLAAGKELVWTRSSTGPDVGEMDLGRSAPVSSARLEEPIEHGQSVAQYTLSGFSGTEWRTLSRGSTIGYARIDRFPPVEISRVRLVIEDQVRGLDPIRIKLYS
jgi:alpha-L-fucosidase